MTRTPPAALPAFLALLATAAAGCGYQLVRTELPAAAGGCVSFDGMEGGGAYPMVALRASSALRADLAGYLCPAGRKGAILATSVDSVEEVSPMVAVPGGVAQEAGGRWAARATVSLEEGGSVVWGPVSVVVEREIFSTGSAIAEGGALEAGLGLLASDLAAAVLGALLGDPAPATGGPP